MYILDKSSNQHLMFYEFSYRLKANFLSVYIKLVEFRELNMLKKGHDSVELLSMISKFDLDLNLTMLNPSVNINLNEIDVFLQKLLICRKPKVRQILSKKGPEI